MCLKVYCDVCGKPIKSQVDRVRRILGDVMIEIMVRFKGTWNAGHVCETCVSHVVLSGRPAKENESWIDDHLKARSTKP